MSKLELLVPTCLDDDHALDDTLTTPERKVLMIDDLTSLSPEHALTRAKRALSSEALAINTVTWARLFCHPSLPCHAYARLQLVISLFSLDLNHFHHLTLFANIHPPDLLHLETLSPAGFRVHALVLYISPPCRTVLVNPA